eukprot:444468-Pyramimonas_sp.AAC.1
MRNVFLFHSSCRLATDLKGTYRSGRSPGAVATTGKLFALSRPAEELICAPFDREYCEASIYSLDAEIGLLRKLWGALKYTAQQEVDYSVEASKICLLPEQQQSILQYL